MNDKEMTAEILRRLRLVPEHKSDINFPEFRWCAGLAGSRRADAFFIQPRPPYFSITYEVKVDRWDFRRDMAEFGKHRKARQFSNFFYYAAPNEDEPKILVYPRGKNPGGLRDGSCPAITANSFQQNIMVCPVVTPGRRRKKQNGRLMKNDGDPSFTLTAREGPGIYDGRLVRKLTPLECERLQGFSDGWTEYGADGKRMSDSVRYKATGNAVSVPIPEAIARALFN